MNTGRAISDILQLVFFPGYQFNVHTLRGELYLQASFEARCSLTGELMTHTTRKWKLSEHMTRSEIVQTALKCVLTSVEHEARERFLYKGQCIFGPHFDVEQLVKLAKADSFDVRKDLTEN